MLTSLVFLQNIYFHARVSNKVVMIVFIYVMSASNVKFSDSKVIIDT